MHNDCSFTHETHMSVSQLLKRLPVVPQVVETLRNIMDTEPECLNALLDALSSLALEPAHLVEITDKVGAHTQKMPHPRHKLANALRLILCTVFERVKLKFV